jgi:hypothetical protein
MNTYFMQNVMLLDGDTDLFDIVDDVIQCVHPEWIEQAMHSLFVYVHIKS